MILSYDSTPETDALNSEILRLEGSPDAVQEMPLQRALSYLIELTERLDDEQIKAELEKAAKMHIVSPPEKYRRRSIKAKLPDEYMSKADELFKKSWGLTRVKRPYFVRVVLSVYYLHLLNTSKSSGVTEIRLESGRENQRTDKLLRAARLILNDRPEDREIIEQILLLTEK